MVTDEERDTCTRLRPRSADEGQHRHSPQACTLLDKQPRPARAFNTLLLSLPVRRALLRDEIAWRHNIYLGDRDGVRTPMQWSATATRALSPADPQRLYLPLCSTPCTAISAVHVDAEMRSPTSFCTGPAG